MQTKLLLEYHDGSINLVHLHLSRKYDQDHLPRHPSRWSHTFPSGMLPLSILDGCHLSLHLLSLLSAQETQNALAFLPQGCCHLPHPLHWRLCALWERGCPHGGIRLIIIDLTMHCLFPFSLLPFFAFTLFLSPDDLLSFPSTAAAHGYTAETHEVLT